MDNYAQQARLDEAREAANKWANRACGAMAFCLVLLAFILLLLISLSRVPHG